MLHAFSTAEEKQIESLIQLSLNEDKVTEDITSKAIFADDDISSMKIIAKQELVFAGNQLIPVLLEITQGSLSVSMQAKDGAYLKKGETIGSISGKILDILAYERTLLNLLQRLCGVATLTHQFAKAIEGTNAKILDTRKTIPGWRALDKYAVRCGGGLNHRMNLADMVMIKDNHIAAAGSIEKAIKKVLHLKEEGIPIVVECDTLEQLKTCLHYSVDRILLDNMPHEILREAVKMANGKIPLEASGGVNLQTIRGIAEAGVDYISVGQITHSAIAVDIGLEAIN